MRSAVQIGIPPHDEQEPYRLPHQGTWFVLLLIGLWLMLSKSVAAWVD